MSMTIPNVHETIIVKYPKECEKCKALMTPVYVKVAHKKAPEPIANTIHYKCDRCGVEYDLAVSLENDPEESIDANMGLLL